LLPQQFLLTLSTKGHFSLGSRLMRKITLGLLAATFSTVSAAALAQSLTLYSGTNFSGQSKQVGLASTNVGGFLARSAEATGKWRVCSGPFGLIGCRTIEGRVADLGGSGLAVMSAVFGLGTGSGQTNPQQTGQVYAPQSGVILFSEPNYTGRQQLVTGDTSNLDLIGFGDQTKSAMVAQNESWQLCENSNFGGNCVTLAGGVPSLSAVNGSGSSLRRTGSSPQPQSYPQHSPYPAQSSGYATATGRTASFFAQPQFNGQPMLACASSPTKPSASCAKKSAEQFCKLSGFSRLAYSAYSSQGYLEDVLCAK
jgi:Beta/Gamma crystallin